MKNELDWNYLGSLPKGEHQLFSMCIWEYARECSPLRANIEALRKLTGDFYGLSAPAEIAKATYERVKGTAPLVDAEATQKMLSRLNAKRKTRGKDRSLAFIERWIELREAIDAIAGRFDWSFLCSASFPNQPWLMTEPKCPIKSRGADFQRTAPLSGKIGELSVSYGKKKRIKKGVHLPPLFRFDGDVANYLADGDVTVFDDLCENVREVMQRPEGPNATAFHCFVVPAQYFDRHSAEDIAAAFRSTCLLLDRRRLIPNDLVAGKFSRRTAKESLEWLAKMRFFHFFDRAERSVVLTKLRKRCTDADAISRHALCLRWANEAGDRALDTYSRLFSVPPDCKPLHFEGQP
jgi:hypothetical protein